MVKPTEAALYAAVGGISTAVAALNVLYPQIRSDLKFIRTFRGPISRVRRYTTAQPPVSPVDRFLHQVQLQPDKPFVLFEDQLYTYRDMDVMSNKVANYFRGESGFNPGDNVAMLVYNEPAFVWTYLGLAKLGVKIALLNTNHRSKSLLHCVTEADTKALIVGQGDALLEATMEILPTLEELGVRVWLQGDKPAPQGFLSLDDKISQSSDQPIPFKLREGILVNDTFCYIFTSGTTGFPKAAKVTLGKALGAACIFGVSKPNDDDVLYVTLPLYHSGGLLFGLGGVIEYGLTMALARKFSATRFWDDCRKYNATMIQHIGELLRYLCAQPKRLQAAYFVKVDPETSEPIRDQNGRCIPVKPGEPGLLLGPVTDATPFVGYQGDKRMTEKKILRNVFKEGDIFFNTGDLLMVDKDYYVYFIDRLGDTYRWKGENVATTEVAEVLHDIDGVQEANVYGVTVPGHDGRAGMAAIVVHPGHRPNMRDWYAHLSSRLPGYARPLFLRLTQDLYHTSTLKQTKTQLVKDGFDPNAVTDSLYIRDDSKKTYVPLDSDVYKAIAVGKAKL
ncbi:PREDICTED: long-chain fatty acid transport protein 3-like isoform X1 [Branchiostoma belcheri]|uniref:long-chain-fatty-acid--CoA ligase n=1 Tax=Branchiostoma belcheri TaxID=7741 RepID=A0A6P4Z304_BRABE|nr:PREDICTED: long-chain fatty acid transport protein 3-like isoform X1 [Branchiostoma belcheri]